MHKHIQHYLFREGNLSSVLIPCSIGFADNLTVISSNVDLHQQALTELLSKAQWYQMYN